MNYSRFRTLIQPFLASPTNKGRKDEKARVEHEEDLVLTGDDRSLIGKLKEIVPAAEQEQVSFFALLKCSCEIIVKLQTQIEVVHK